MKVDAGAPEVDCIGTRQTEKMEEINEEHGLKMPGGPKAASLFNATRKKVTYFTWDGFAL